MWRFLLDEGYFYGVRGWCSLVWAIALNRGFQCCLLLRLVAHLGRGSGGVVYGLVNHLLGILFSSEISPGARLGRRLCLPHPHGIVIGSGARIGHGVIIFQHVTIGKGRETSLGEYPLISDGVTIFPNSVLFGGISVGKNSKIGAGSVVFCDVAPGTTMAGNPARRIK